MHFAIGFGARHQQRMDAAVIDHAGESIAGDEKNISRFCVALVDVWLDVMTRTDATGYDVAVRMILRLLRRQESRADLLLDVRVVLRELNQRSVSQQIHPSVAR